MYNLKVSSLYIRLLIILFFFLLIFIIWNTGIYHYFSLSNIQMHSQALQAQVAYHYWRTVSLYWLIFIVLVLCGLPLVALMSIVGGFLFGVIPSIFYINSAATVGAILFFLCVRYLIGTYLQSRYSHELVRFNTALEKNGQKYLLLLRCIPVIPFFMVNIFAGLTQVKWTTFAWTTSVGILPTSLIFAYAGRQLTGITSLGDVFCLPVIGIFCLLLACIIIPVLINWRWKIF